jgi:hypothetical protein
MPLPPGYSFSNSGLRAQRNGYNYDVPSREDIQMEKENYQATFEDWDWQGETGPNGQALPEFATGWKPNGEADFGTGLAGWGKKFMSNVRGAWQTGYQEGIKISSLTQFGMEKLNPVAGKNLSPEEAQKKVQEMQAERKPKDQNAAYWAAAVEATKEGFNQALWGVLEGLGSVAKGAEQTIGSAAYAIADTIEGKDINWQRNWDASRMLYSGLFDATIFSEMERRIDAGIRPDLAEQEIMIEKKWTMWPELIGQVIFDPLNVVSVIGKAGAQAKIVKNVSKTFHEVANPNIAKLIGEAGETLAKLDDATAYRNIDEIVKAQQGLTAVAEHADDIAQAGKDLEAFSQSYKLASMTRDGKVAHIANQTGEILMHIVNNSDPDEALEIIRGMVLSTSNDTEKAAEGVAAMLHFPDAPALFSQAGNNTTVLLSRMYEKYGDTWLKTLGELKDNPVELTKNLLGKLDEVGEEMFPSVTKMLDAEKAVKAGGQVSDAVRALAERAKNLPEYVKAATRFHDKAQTIVGPINKAFAGAYMGWSPGYAFRNFSNNSLQMLIDYGPGVLLGKADDLLAKTEKLHGGLLQGAVGFGEAGAMFADKAEGLTDAASTLKAIKSETTLTKGPAQIMAAKMEANAAKRIIAKTYRQSWDKGVKAMVKSLAPDLKAAGFSDDIIKKLPTYILNNDGDAGKVIQALRSDIDSGVIDLFNDISRIDPKHKGFLESAGKWDEYVDNVLQAKTPEAANQAATKIFDDLAQAADEVYREARPAVDNYDKFLKMAEDSGMPSQRGQLVSLRKTESRKAIQAAEAILAEADDLGAQMGLQVGTMKKARKITGLNTWGNDAAKEADRINDLTWKLTKDAKKGGNVQQLWMAYPELFPGTPPANMDTRTFLDALWHNYDQVTSKTWGAARDTAIENVTGYLDDLKASGVEVPQDWYDTIKMAQEGAQQYDNAMIGRLGELVEDTPMPYGSRTSQINNIAAKNGIATATDAGLPTDKKTLAIINKYAGVNYKSLEDVPLEVAEEAFAKKAGKATKAATATQPELAKTPLTMDDATQLPRSELDPEVSGEFERVAKELQRELFEGEAGKRLFTEAGVIGQSSTNADWYKELYRQGLRKQTVDKALEKVVLDAGKDTGKTVERVKELIVERIRFGDPKNGIPPNLKVLQAMGADPDDMARALDDYNDITRQTKTLDELLGRESVQLSDEAAELAPDPDLPYFDEAGNLVEPKRKRILPPSTDGEMPTAARAIHEQMDGVKEIRQWMMDDIAKNYGKKQLVNGVQESAMKTAERELTQKLAENRLISSRVAQANRDFTLLNYGEKSYWDTALAYLYPYHYWYKGTYTNWMKRIAQNPSVLAHYSKYKDTLATVHADMPEWWKYNINSNDLPGVDTDNPLYFNLEATLWPLNGITGIDFNDSSKRVNGWTYALDQLNKFGPSTWTPISMITGLSLYAQGEREAGEKWMGRLFPQSNVIKAVGSKLGVTNLETDPFVKFLQGGLDPYERRRVQRALAEIEQEAIRGEVPYTREQIQDAAYSQDGEIWEEAIRRAVNGKSGSQISSYLFGVGFKGRSQEDMEIDEFQTAYGKLWTMRPNLTPEEFREGMDKLKGTYPFMDTLLLSRRDTVERDSGFAYTVMNRIPPGQSSKIAQAAGIDPKLMEMFYDTKGQIEKWPPADRQKFMAGILNIAATLEIPEDVTRAEWTQAKNAYSGLTTEAKDQFGDNILDLVDGYYAAKTKSYQAADAYLEKHPDVESYMNWRSERILNSPILSAYYGGASMVENYQRSKMYAEIETKLGKDIFDVMDQYNDAKTYGTPEEAKKIYNQNKARIKQYYSIKDDWTLVIDRAVAQLGATLPEGQGVSIRPDVQGVGAQQLAGALQEPEMPSYEDFQAFIPSHVLSLVEDYFTQGERLPESAEKQLDRLANEMGYDSGQDLIQAIGSSMYASP